MMTNQTNVNSLNNEERGVENCTATQGQDSLLKDVGIPMEKEIDRIVDSFQTAYGCVMSPNEIHKLDALLSKGVTEELCLFACKVFSTSKRPFQEVLRALGRPYDAHEQMNDQELAEEMQLWYRNGGRVTHQYWKHIRKDVREEIIQYLQKLDLNCDVEVNGIHYRLVHGAPTEEYQNFLDFYLNPTHFSVWKRWRKFETQHGQYTVVFGHSPTIYYQSCKPMAIWCRDHRIGIDCGSGYPENSGEYYGRLGRLACLRLDDMKEYYSEKAHAE